LRARIAASFAAKHSALYRFVANRPNSGAKGPPKQKISALTVHFAKIRQPHPARFSSEESDMRYRLSLFSAFMLFFLGAAITPAAHAAPPDVCTLLTQAQVGAVIGVSVGPCESIAGGRSGTWAELGKPGDNAKKVIVTIISMQGYDMGKTPMNGISKTPLTGVGDEAYSMTRRSVSTIHFKTGDLAFAVDVRSAGATSEQLIAMEKSLGQQIVAKR
jgi:hypothetical protein